MSDYPIYFEVSEIESHLNSIKRNKNKIEYLVSIREEFILLCYHFCDNRIDKYFEDNKIKPKFSKIMYYPSNDIYQTHISRSEHIFFLKHIDAILLPFVRENIKKLDSSIKEDTSKIIKDYKIFDFDIVKIVDYVNELAEEKVEYLYWILSEYITYIFKMNKYRLKNNKITHEDVKEIIRKSPFRIKIREKINALQRYPEIILPNEQDYQRNKILNMQKDSYFADEELVFNFKFLRVKKYVLSLKDKNEKITYLEYVKKEAKQNKHFFPDKEYYENLLDRMEIEIDYLNRIPVCNYIAESHISLNSEKNHFLKFRWQKDNVLLPYLFEVLLDEGFISQSDFEDRHKFIEQSFLKKNGKPFTSKESDQAEINYRTNSKSGKKPRNAFKVDRAVTKLKSKEKKTK